MISILVKAPNWVGDCVMATPALEFLRSAFPDARIDVMARPSVAAVFAENPHITQLIVADDRKLEPDTRVTLHSNRYDAAALMPNSLSSAWLALKLWIPKRIGFSRGGRALLLTHRISYRGREWQTPTPKPLSSKSIPGEHPPAGAAQPRHMVHYYLRIAHETALALGGRVYSGSEETPPQSHLRASEESRRRVEDLLVQRGLAGKKLVGLNAGAAYGSAKRWPPERLGEVAAALAADGIEIVTIASRFESELTNQIESMTKCKIHRLGEELSLADLIALLPQLAVLITNDSGPMHMAAALEVPTVAIFGPTDWNVTSPWQQRASVVRHSPQCSPCFLRECPIDHRCMERISAEQVISAARKLMAVAADEQGPQR